MIRTRIPRGMAGVGVLLIISFVAILLAISSLHIQAGQHSIYGTPGPNSMGYEPYSVKPRKGKPWWEEEVSRSETIPSSRTSKVKSSLDLSLPNTGLKKPDEITWPYGNEFRYQLNLRDWIALPGYEHTTEVSCTYEGGDEGGVFSEYKARKSGYESSEGTFRAEFDALRKISKINYTYKGRTLHPMGTIKQDFHIRVEYEGDMIRISSDWPFVFLEGGEPVSELEVDAPSDGFFDFTGSDSPASTAILLSAADLDGDEPVEFWAFGLHGISIGPGVLQFITGTDSLFTRFRITPLEKCSREAKKWWDDSRDYFDGWKPPENVRTYIFEGDAEAFYGYLGNDDFIDIIEDVSDLYSPQGPWVAAYVDEEGRVIRIEQPTDIESPLTILTNVGGEKAWWETKTK